MKSMAATTLLRWAMAFTLKAIALKNLRAMVRDAVQCHFGDGILGHSPEFIRLKFIREEILVA